MFIGITTEALNLCHLNVVFLMLEGWLHSKEITFSVCLNCDCFACFRDLTFLTRLFTELKLFLLSKVPLNISNVCCELESKIKNGSEETNFTKHNDF